MKLSARLFLFAACAAIVWWFVRRDSGSESMANQGRVGAVRVIKDRRYTAGEDVAGDKHSLDLYLPRDRTGFPVLLFVHGGSWVGGSKAEFTDLGTSMAGRGIGLVVINYRLSPEVRHPAHIQDLARAFAWTHANIGEYGGRKDQIFVWGHSAGGHLAALLGTDESFLKAERLSFLDLRGVIPMSGDYRIKPGRWPEVFGDGTGAGPDPSPVNHIDGKRPPFLILFAEHDSSSVHRQSDELCAALRARSSEASSIEIKNRGHASIMHELTRPGDMTLQAILDFIASHTAS